MSLRFIFHNEGNLTHTFSHQFNHINAHRDDGITPFSWYFHTSRTIAKAFGMSAYLDDGLNVSWETPESCRHIGELQLWCPLQKLLKELLVFAVKDWLLCAVVHIEDLEEDAEDDGDYDEVEHVAQLKSHTASPPLPLLRMPSIQVSQSGPKTAPKPAAWSCPCLPSWVLGLTARSQLHRSVPRQLAPTSPFSNSPPLSLTHCSRVRTK